MRRVLGGLGAGFCAWIFVALLISLTYTTVHDYYIHFNWIQDGIPVLVGGCVAGYIVKRRGLVYGGIIGASYALMLVAGFFSMVAFGFSSEVEFTTTMGLVKEMGYIQPAAVASVVVLPIGAVGGYMGQGLARVRNRRTGRLGENEVPEPKTYRFRTSGFRWQYILIGLFAYIYPVAMWLVLTGEYYPLCTSFREVLQSISFLQLLLIAWFWFTCMFIRRSRTRVRFCPDHLSYYGAEVLPFNCRIPWSTMQEIVVKSTRRCKASIYYRDARNDCRQVEIPLFLFSEMSDMVEQLKDTAEKKGIPLREV
jgi:hypothetical protein